MNVAVFNTKSFDQEYFNQFIEENRHTLTFFETRLKESTVNLAQGFDGVCIFVNDRLNARVIDRLAKLGVKLIALRCTGNNNVDLGQLMLRKLQLSECLHIDHSPPGSR